MSHDYIVQRRIKLQKLQRKARRIEIAAVRTYKIIKLIIIIAILYFLYRFCNSTFWMLPLDIYTNNNTASLKITGNSIVKSEQIIEKMKKVPLEQKPIFRINPYKIQKSIETLEPVRNAYIRRYAIPARIVVMIEEYNPVLTIAHDENSAEVAAYALSGQYIPKEYLPLDSKFNTTKILAGSNYEKWDKNKIELLYRLSKTVREYSGEKIIYIDLRQPNNIFIQLKSVKIRLGELDQGAFERIKAIYYILPKLKTMKEKIKYVDLSWRDSRYLKLDRGEKAPQISTEKKESEQNPNNKPLTAEKQTEKQNLNNTTTVEQKTAQQNSNNQTPSVEQTAAEQNSNNKKEQQINSDKEQKTENTKEEKHYLLN